MPNDVGFRAFRTSSQRSVPIQPAMRASTTLTGKASRRRVGGCTSVPWEAESQRVLLALCHTGVYSDFHLLARSF